MDTGYMVGFPGLHTSLDLADSWRSSSGSSLDSIRSPLSAAALKPRGDHQSHFATLFSAIFGGPSAAYTASRGGHHIYKLEPSPARPDVLQRPDSESQLRWTVGGMWAGSRPLISFPCCCAASHAILLIPAGVSGSQSPTGVTRRQR